MIDDNSSGLYDGLVSTYEYMVDSVHHQDTAQLRDIMEGNLASSYNTFFEGLREDYPSYKLEQHGTHSTPKFTVVDFNNVMYASINRAENRQNGLQRILSKDTKFTNDKCFFPSNFANLPMLYITVEFLIMVESGLTLQLAQQGEQPSDVEQEYHFMRMEGIIGKAKYFDVI